MPRPETCVTFDAVENPGSKMHSISWASVGCASGRDPALRDRLGPDPFEVEAGAVVGELDLDLVRDLPHGKRDLAGLGLAGLRALRAVLDAVVERVAQQVLERPDELLQHRAVELGLPAADLEVRALAELARRSAQDPVQALRQAAERHGADREELLLQIPREPALHAERGVRDVEVLQQRLLDRRHVIDAFAQRARELLEARIAVEFERVEAFLALAHLHQARLDLRLGLDLDLAHLRAQTEHAAGELEQVGLERTQLAFDSRPRDRDLARLVDQAVDDVGAHAQHRARARFDGLRVRSRLRAVGRRTATPPPLFPPRCPPAQRRRRDPAPRRRRLRPCRPTSSATLVLPSRSASSTNAMRSRSPSRASKSSADPETGASSTSRRDSIRCTSSPRRMAPAIRALPLNVWSVRRSWRARASSPGARRHARTRSPACG